MTPETFIPIFFPAVAMGAIGFAFGLAYFAALRRTVSLYVARRRWFAALALTLGRTGAAIIIFVLAAKLGVAALLATFAGFLVARIVTLRVQRRAA
ncbi:MAG: ATP synthase subunit I [Methylocella sp.]